MQISPLANGFHRQLKSAIMWHEGSICLEALPLVLLGLRSAIKFDINTSTAEMTYGEPFQVHKKLSF